MITKTALSTTDIQPLWTRPISGILGRLNSPVQALMLGTSAPLKETASLSNPEMQAVIDHLKDVPQLSNTQVNFGSSSIIDDLYRNYTNPKTSVLSKIIGTAAVPLTDVATSLLRADHYNPFSDSVVVYNSDPAILRHELGHAEDYSNRDAPIAYAYARKIPGVVPYQEYTASNLGTEHLLDTLNLDGSAESKVNALNKLEHVNQVLGGGLGSYIGASTLGLIGMTPKVRKLVSDLATKIKLKGVAAKLFGKAGLSAIGGIGGALIGQAIGKSLLPFIPEGYKDKINDLKAERDEMLIDKAKQLIKRKL